MVGRAELPARRRRAARAPRETHAAFSRALKLREALYRVFAARVEGRAPAASDLDVLNEALRRALPRQRLVPAKGGLGWRWEEDDELDYPLWPIARSAADLLVSPDASLVQERLRRVQLDVPGPQPRPPPPLVRHEGLRQPRQGAAVLPEAAGQSLKASHGPRSASRLGA